ncbi:tape measure protein [Chitinophaga varians]|uniref:tape measure protein n=1 Tax=Chitinophaga varians TaxID=2202339 RepID=UPI00165FA998|nr:tape measure protein [Chitinophaga varians]MBC9913189.1 tape measure protein [Chitinophaga varians]
MALNVNGGALEFDAIINGSQFQAQINAMERQLRSLSERAKKESSDLEQLAQKAAAAIGSYLSITAATNFVKKMIEVRGEFQQLEVAFTTMLQSKEKADQLLADVADLAAKTPFGLQDAAQGTKQLLAYGFQADEIVDTLTRLGNVASGVSAPLNDVVYLYGTLKTQGRAYSQDIKQFTGRGIPILQELAKQYGVAADEVNDLVAAGKVGFPDIEKAFKSMTSEGGMFFNLMQEQSKTLVGQISNLSDAFDMMLNNMGKQTQGIASTTIQGLTTLVENYQAVLDVLEVLIVAYGTYRAAVIAVNVVTAANTVINATNTAGVGAMTIWEYLYLQSLVAVEKAQKLLNATMLSNPYVAIATLLAALVTAMIVMKEETIKAKSAQDLLKDANDKVTQGVSKQTAAISPYISILKNANATEKEREVALKKLAEISPKIVDGLNAQSISQERLKQNVDAYIDSLREKYRVEALGEKIKESIELEEKFREQIKYTQKAIEDAKNATGVEKNENLGPVYERQLKEQEEQLKKQIATTKELASGQVQEEAKRQVALKLTNAQLIAQAKSLDDIDAVRDKIDKDRKAATSQEEQIRLTNDLLAADKRRAEIDIYAARTKSGKEALKVESKLKALLDQIIELEARATSVNEGKEDGTVAKLQGEVSKLAEKAKAIKASDGVVLRIQKAGKILIDDATAKAAARDVQNQLNTELSNININLSESKPNTEAELLLRKEGIAKRVQLDIEATKQQYANDIKSQQALQAKTNEIKAAGRREALDLDREYAQRAVDIQLQAIKDQADIKNIQDQRIVNNPTSTVNQRYEAQQRILERNKKAIKDMIAALEAFEKTGLGNATELNKQIEQLYRNLSDVTTEGNNLTKSHLIEVFENLQKVLGSSSGALRSFASDLAGINDGLADTLNTMADLTDQVSSIVGTAQGISAYSKGNAGQGNSNFSAVGGLVAAGATIGAFFGGIGAPVGAAIGAIAGAVVAILKGGKKVRESLQKTYEAIYTFQINQELGEYRINALLRQRNLIKAQELKLTLDNMKAQEKALTLNQKQNQSDQDRIMALLQQESYITGVDQKKYGGFLGLWRKSMPVNQYSTLLGMTFDQIEALYQSGQLDGKAKALFEQLQQLQQEGKDIQSQLDALADKAKEVFTGTTADSITDSIVEGFKNGQYAAESFADNFEELMRGAALNALKYQYLEGPLKDFYNQFAKASESDGVLTKDEIQQLQEKYNQIIKSAGDQFQQLQDITGLNLASGSGNSQNSLKGAFSSMTEQTAELLAGQFGGLRINMIQQVQICTQQLSVLTKIEFNTATLIDVRADIRYLKDKGIKIVK